MTFMLIWKYKQTIIVGGCQMRSEMGIQSSAEINCGYVEYDPVERLIQSESPADYYERKFTEMGESQDKFRRDQEARFLAEIALGGVLASDIVTDLCGEKGYFEDKIDDGASIIDSPNSMVVYDKDAEYRSVA